MLVYKNQYATLASAGIGTGKVEGIVPTARLPIFRVATSAESAEYSTPGNNIELAH
jgi:hypothetical protein